MASRLSPTLRLLRTTSPFRQTLTRPLRPQIAPSFHHTGPSTSRLAHYIPKPPQSPTRSISDSSSSSDGTPAPRPPTKPDSYSLTFTCRPCSTRSQHIISKQGYHHGSVLVSCPECKNRHVISDHLGIFGDRKITVEDLVREQGGIVRKGTLGEDGDIEFWPDETGKDEAKPDGKQEEGGA
ncbi:related to ZIM17 ZInc finger Motif protein, localized to the mitochondria [Cephalotrichum gorgonifer]|uniref:Related to ZIM17 ZInc finger Motif protein, localized to the mitochondria n=1 Tax=Cephalotrichum gorgonifer TaxID=2041049 RepID=A0AAE8MQI2_9PEZI|nr:related to ZIM17 ZInc finger Motif protein, localized to the mitochondria [Cephalotrichum gorgonifer]